MVIVFLIFNNHWFKILDTQSEQLGWLRWHRGELTLHLVEPILPVTITYVSVPLDIMDNVNESKRVPFINPNVHQIEMLWKHVATATFFQKVHVSDIVTFKMDVLLVILNLALQKGAEPSYENFWLIL